MTTKIRVFRRTIKSEILPVVERANARLSNKFDIALHVLEFKPIIDAPDVSTVDIDKGRVKTGTTKTKSYERRWYTLWLYKHEVWQETNVYEDEFRVSLEAIIEETVRAFNDGVDGLRQGAEVYIDEEIGKQVSDYFKRLTNHLDSFRKELIKAREDHKLTSDEQESLKNTCSHLIQESIKVSKYCENLLSKINSSRA